MRTLIAAVVLIAAPAATAWAQTAAVVPAGVEQQAPATQLPQPANSPSPERLGISLDRIREELRETPPTQSNLLRYDFHVEVYGTNPGVDLFKDFDLSPGGAVRYGGMTHSEFLGVVTPQAFKAPSGGLLSLALFAIQQIANRSSNDGAGVKRDR